MGKLGRRALVLVLAALSMSVIAACGGDEDSGGGGGGGGGGAAKNGGSITISQTSQPDFLDPALMYTVNGIEPGWLVYTPLLTYPRTGDAVKDALNTKPNLDAPDEFYQRLVDLHQGLTEEQSRLVNAKLVLLLANHIGNSGVLEQALARARPAI